MVKKSSVTFVFWVKEAREINNKFSENLQNISVTFVFWVKEAREISNLNGISKDISEK